MSAPRRPVSFFTSATMSAVAWLMVSSAPSARAAASFASVDAVAITRAPQSFAIWIAAVPTPEPAGDHQHGLALLDRRAVDQHLPRRHEHRRDRGELRVVERRRGARGAGTRLAAGTTTYSA